MPANYSRPIQIRDSRNGSWFWIHTHVWRDKKISQSSKVIYGTIASYANTHQTAFPSIAKISFDSDISERHVYRCLKELQKNNYLTVEKKRGKPNLYTLVKTTPDIMSPLTSCHPTPDIDDSTTPDKKAVLTRTIVTRTINNTKKSEFLSKAEEITHWAYKRALVIPSMSPELFKKKVAAVIERAGYEPVRKLYATEENAITFLHGLKSL